jgi:hypothetical protein
MRSKFVSVVTKLVVLIAVLALLAACGGSSTTKSSESASAPTAAPTQAQKVAAPSPTQAAGSTQTPKATEAPQPMATAEPVPTTAPTVAPTAAKPTEAAKAEAPTGQAGIDLLLGAMRAQLAQKAFRMTVTSEDGGKSTTMTIEYVAPDSLHSKTEATEVIVVEGTTYIKGSDGKWQKSPMDMSGMISQALSPEIVDEMAKNITVEKLKFVGPDLIDGKPMWVYRYETTMDLAGTKIDSTAKVWLGALDKLPYRQESESDSIVNKEGKTKSTIVYAYDPNIKIEAPIK